MRELFAKSRGVNLLAAARIFLFGARDVWFVVGLPVFLYAAGWRFVEVGGFLAAWTIGYGVVQAIAPSPGRAQRRRAQPRSPDARAVGRPAGRGAGRPGAAAAAIRDLWRPDLVVVAAWRCSACRSPSIPRCTPT